MERYARKEGKLLGYLLAPFFLLSIAPVQGSYTPCDVASLGYAPPPNFASCCSFDGHINYIYMKAKIAGDCVFTMGQGEGSGGFTRIYPRRFNGMANLASRGTSPVLSLKEVFVDWDGGFEMGGGWHLPRDQWSIEFNWLHYKSSTVLDLPFQGGGGVSLLETDLGASFLSQYGTPLSADYAYGQVDTGLHLNLLDLYLSRSFAVGPSLYLKPKVGLLGLFARDYFTANTPFALFADIDNYLFAKTHQQISGGGVFVGLDTDWEIGCGFSIYGQFDLGAVGCHANLVQSHTQLRGAAGASGLNPSTAFEVEKFDPLLRYQLGATWNFPALYHQADVSVSLGWEAIYLFNHDLFVRYVFSEAKPLVLQGLSFSIAISI